ncbi:hypothetical protein ACFQI7_02300 [Paenibacillus allorhizosphaerae]|uniref:DUF4363 family protein n=1 Tax=Paenibacillus allorhizosphaerae TaxID=2849866 RepID=A0ABM8VAV4_9BACL|nr:hypothetical protein [Paenibacillus allorhizosphaerae]CAG7617559.1 hypothetical protein PAECIP111802_00422 [Paenibacillus allorhizosphaerae]
MTAIVVIIAATLLSLFAIMAATSWLMTRLMKAYVGSKHELLEQIIRTERVPEQWSSSYGGAAANLAGRSDGSTAPADRKEARKSIRKLDRLIGYVRTTRLVEDEETRQTLLADLSRIRSQWGEGRRHEQPAGSQ